MDTKESCENTDVVIVGAGPTGTLLSALLGTLGIPNVVLESEAAITEDPRGIAFDEDGIRQLQAVGIYGNVYSEIGSM
jgi:2-polyprenyl-6-methoxyphenol hydroxylase-like FAD-dependent oxidoreductase